MVLQVIDQFISLVHPNFYTFATELHRTPKSSSQVWVNIGQRLTDLRVQLLHSDKHPPLKIFRNFLHQLQLYFIHFYFQESHVIQYLPFFSLERRCWSHVVKERDDDNKPKESHHCYFEEGILLRKSPC